MKRKHSLILAVAALSFSALALLTIQPMTVLATSVESEFKIKEGASVRLATEEVESEQVSGIRFAAYITKPYYEELIDTYSNATTITLQSTISKVVEENVSNPVPFTCSWDMKEEIVFNNKGVATFYHTLNFNTLTGEELKAASAFEMEADFWIEVVTDADVIKIQADNEGEVDTTRSMRQVAYMAYMTPGTTANPNAAYHDERLKTYFTLGASTEAVYDMDVKTKKLSEIVPENVEVDNAYVVSKNTLKAVADFANTTLADGSTGLFTEEEAKVSTTKTLVYFDSNNVAYTSQTRFVTKIVDNATELKDLMKWGTSKQPVWGYNLLNADLEISDLSSPSARKVIESGTFDGNGHKITISTISPAKDDKALAHGLFGKLAAVTVKNLEIDLTMDFGIGASFQTILAYDTDSTTLFENLSLRLHRAEGDATENVNKKLYITYDGQATARNVTIYVDDGTIITSAEKIVVDGFTASPSCYIFGSKIKKDSNEKYQPYASVAAALDAKMKFLDLRTSGYWTLDAENKALVFGKTDDMVLDAATEVTITQTSMTSSNDFTSSEYKGMYIEFEKVAEPLYTVPGLAEGFIPQGIDVWEEKDLAFISGYFKTGINTSGSPSSMLLAVDLKTGELAGKYCIKKEDGTYYTGHNGGIAITEKNIFIENSGLARIPLSQIEILGQSGTLQIVETIKVNTGAAFINYSNGVLWTGNYFWEGHYDDDSLRWMHMTNDGVTYHAGAVGFKLVDTDSEFSKEHWDPTTMSVARPDYYLAIPDYVQGFTFFENQFVLSTCYSNKPSHIQVYENVLETAPVATTNLNGCHTSNPVNVWFLDSDALVVDYQAMELSEGITSYDGKLLLVFESGAIAHMNNGALPTDQIWSITLPKKED